MDAEDSQMATDARARAETYPFLGFHEKLEVALKKLKGHPRHAAVNALRCLRRGWAIAPIDPEMAAFRAITAEEEAATALIVALKQKNYPGADRLNHRDHAHKSGLKPFLRAIEDLMARTGFPVPHIYLQHGAEKPRIELQIPLRALGVDSDLVATPDEPLNGLMYEGRIGEGTKKVMTFERELQELAESAAVGDILELIRRDANLRNVVLYANQNGSPEVSNVDAELIARRRAITLLLCLTLIIMQTNQHQLLAVQALEAYLKALGKMPADVFDYEAAVGSPRA